MSDAIQAETVAQDAGGPVVAISDPGEVGRAEHNRGDRFIVQVSNFFAWIFPILMVVIVAQVLLRNLGRIGIGPGNQAWMDDLQWWLYGAAVLIGVAYAVTTNSHVRVDIFYDGYPERKQRWIDIFGLSWLFLPFIILCWDVTLAYALQSIASGEGSSSPNGLHGLYFLKSFVNVAFLLVAVATWFAYLRMLAKVKKPTLWNQLVYALPSVAFAINLAIYYAALGIAMLVTDAETAREASRTWFFDEIDLPFNQEMKITVLTTLIVTAAVLAVVYLTRDKDGDAA
ncbi:TRAP transporter small permease subunit [Jannaschia seohaensis]|uniref:TRAP transporter small permease protein n=1 Tax=Jannaschia seohaensis TaxID=475081 RepID=A0A2Y9AGK9_9RHOB|nr:TRAP transporter small permease subunit [Jannaschia seohaensis]PWJ21087.1 TRAP-type mannitol/chloroaromatic compound transport system permease small subunit [Jannaschia seohaensis]SSA41497.1 TRAP-type mannitol/chloroaromatic compound transport system, small permease component [Jannaschia seohaensis]